MKRWIAIFFLLVGIFATAKGVHTLRDGFSIRRVQPIALKADPLSPEIANILKQPFHYLGRGRQSFAFASEDGNYVLKLPRTEIFKPPLFFSNSAVIQRRKERQKFFLRSFEIAHKILPDQTAVLALHIGHSDDRGELLLYDKMGQKIRLPIRSTSFILQEKKPLLTQVLLKEKRMEILQSWAQLIVERSRRGVENRDPSFLRNYGYDGKRAYQIDIGSLNPKDPALFQKSARDSAAPIQLWLGKVDPKWLAAFNDFLESELQSDRSPLPTPPDKL